MKPLDDPAGMKEDHGHNKKINKNQKIFQKGEFLFRALSQNSVKRQNFVFKSM